jgi:hypothetical protein
MNRWQLCGRLFLFLFGSIIFELHADQKPLVIVIPSYNNSKWYLQNLDSVFAQKYENYRVIYIDDFSNDSTAQLVEQYVAQRHQDQRFLLIRNNKRCGALANHYKAVHMCENNEIIVQLDGDDWFKHDNVLNIVNAAYQNNNVWLTYGQYEMYPPEHPGISRKLSNTVIANNGYRESKWITSALRTFYAGLFKRIKLQDMLYQGTFFKAACDLAFMYPMLEMCGGNVQFIDEIVYVYNCSTNCNDFKMMLQTQLHYDSVIRAQKKYTRLFTPPQESTARKNQLADIIIFANQKKDLDKCLKSIKSFMTGYNNCFIFYSIDSDIEKAADNGDFDYSCVQLKPIYKNDDYKKIILDTLLESKTAYTLIMSDKWQFITPISIETCVRLMEKTGAYCFSLSLGKNIKSHYLLARDQKIPLSQELDEGILAWQFINGEYDWQGAHNFNATFYHKNDLKKIFNQLNFSSYSTLHEAWSRYPFDLHSVGLYFEQVRAIN